MTPEPYGIGLVGKSTGNHGFYHEIWGGSCNFPFKNPLNMAWVLFPGFLHGFLHGSSQFSGSDLCTAKVGDERPLTQGKFSPDAQLFCTSSWFGPRVASYGPVEMAHFNGLMECESQLKSVANPQRSGFIKLWKTPSCDPVLTIRGHEDRRSLGKITKGVTDDVILGAKNTSF